MRSWGKVWAADVPALMAATLVGLNRNTTPRYDNGLRLRIVELARKEAGPMAGEVSVDESYFGGRRGRGQRGWGARGKTPVTGLLSACSNAAERFFRKLSSTAPNKHWGP